MSTVGTFLSDIFRGISCVDLLASVIAVRDTAISTVKQAGESEKRHQVTFYEIFLFSLYSCQETINFVFLFGARQNRVGFKAQEVTAVAQIVCRVPIISRFNNFKLEREHRAQRSWQTWKYEDQILTTWTDSCECVRTTVSLEVLFWGSLVLFHRKLSSTGSCQVSAALKEDHCRRFGCLSFGTDGDCSEPLWSPDWTSVRFDVSHHSSCQPSGRHTN